jgi:alkylation response protein AidB-like acyl-CoA dehydrogenase
MFDLGIGEDLQILVDTARSFAQGELAPRLRASEEARAVAPGLRRSFAQIGLARLELPEELGGAALGALARALVNEELAAADAGAALALDPLGPALYALGELGGEAALRSFALPLLEREGSRALLVHARDAKLEIGATAVSGTIPWLPADRVDLLVVLGVEGAVVVERGFELDRLRGAGLRAAGASELRLAAAPIAARWLGSAEAARALGRARLHTASLLLGVLRQAAEFSREYAQQRVAFGKPIAHHQALAFLIADMRAAVDGARLLVHEAAWHAERGLGFEALAASAYAEVIEASRFVGPNGVQILGGHGFMQDYPVEKYMREARALGLGLGGIDAAREDAGRALCAQPGPVALSHLEGSAWNS